MEDFTRGLPMRFNIYAHEETDEEAEEFSRFYAKGTGVPPKAIQTFLETNPLYEVEFSYGYDPETEEISLVSVKVGGDVVLRTS